MEGIVLNICLQSVFMDLFGFIDSRVWQHWFLVLKYQQFHSHFSEAMHFAAK